MNHLKHRDKYLMETSEEITDEINKRHNNK